MSTTKSNGSKATSKTKKAPKEMKTIYILSDTTISKKDVIVAHKNGEQEFDAFAAAKKAALSVVTKEIKSLQKHRHVVWSMKRSSVRSNGSESKKAS